MIIYQEISIRSSLRSTGKDQGFTPKKLSPFMLLFSSTHIFLYKSPSVQKCYLGDWEVSVYQLSHWGIPLTGKKSCIF